MDLSSLRESSMLISAADAPTSTGQLELGRPRAPDVSKFDNGDAESTGSGKNVYATGAAEADRQHRRG